MEDRAKKHEESLSQLRAERVQLEEEISSKQQKLLKVEELIKIFEQYLLPSASENQKLVSPPVRKRQDVRQKVEKILEESLEPLHVNDILTQIQKIGVSTTKQSLTSTIQVNLDKSFVRVGRNTYDLHKRHKKSAK